jgi:hypothetical protein
MKNLSEFFHGEEFKKEDQLFRSKLIEWREQNKQLLIDNDLEDSNLFIMPLSNNNHIEFDNNVPESIRKEITKLLKSSLPSHSKDQ